MRHVLPLFALTVLTLGCGKKPAPAPTQPDDTPAAETPVAHAEPSDRDKLLTTLKTKRGDAQRDAAEKLASLAATDASVLDALVELLRDKTTAGAGQTHPTQIRSTREAAAFALLRAGPKGEAALQDKGFVALREGLADKDPVVREHTLHTIGTIGPLAKPLGASVFRHCTDSDENVRARAFDTYRSIGAIDVPGVAALLNNKQPDVRRAAAEIIMAVGEVPAGATLSLTRALESEDDVVRIAAATGLAAGPKGGTSAVAEKLAEAVRRSYPEVFDPNRDDPHGPELAYWAALARLGGKPAVDVLTELLKYKNPLVRMYALRTLGDLGPAAKTTSKAVADMLTDAPEVAFEAVVTLARIGEKDEDVAGLLKAAFASNGPGVVAAAVEAVARMGPAGKPYLAAALKQLESPQADARYAAVSLVGMMEPGEAAKQVSALGKLVADPEPLVRRRVGVVLEQLGPAAAPAADAIGKALAAETDEAVRDQFVDTLVAIGPGAKPAVAGLLPIVTDANAPVPVRVKVIGAVAASDPASQQAAAALVKATEDKDQAVRVAAARAIGMLNPLADEARAALVKMMQSDPREAGRTAAVRGLTAAGPRAKAAKPELEKVAAGTMPGLALWARVAVFAVDGDVSKAAGVVRDALANRSLAVRTAAAEALLLVGPQSADVPALLKLSREQSNGAKEAAATALGRAGAGAKEAVPRLVELLGESDSGVRVAAAEALGRIGPAALPAAAKLREAAKSDPQLVSTARKALDRIGVKDEAPKP